MRKSFNENSFLNLVSNAPLNTNKMDLVLNVLNQRSDKSRLGSFNHNCIIINNPFCWSYYHNDEYISVISFPMEKITTGWRFYLDIEESGELYLSEGKHTNRTPLPTKAISWLSRSTQKKIFESLEMLFAASERFCYDFASIIKKPDYLYSYIPLSVVPNLGGLYGTTVYGCYESLRWENHQYSGESTILIKESESKDCWYVRFVNCKWQICHMYDGMTLYKNPKNIYQFKINHEDLFKTIEPDSDHWLNQINLGEYCGNKSFFIANNKIYEKWSEIPEDLRPRIFVEDSQYNVVSNNTPSRFFCFDDIEDIILNTNLGILVSFKNRHKLPEGWDYDWKEFNEKYPINNVPHESGEDLDIDESETID